MHFVVAVACFCSFVVDLQWGTADAEIKVSSAENSERLKVLPLQPGEGQNRDTRTSPTAGNFFLSNSYTTSGPIPPPPQKKKIPLQPLPSFFSPLRQVWLRLINCCWLDCGHVFERVSPRASEWENCRRPTEQCCSCVIRHLRGKCIYLHVFCDVYIRH